MVSYAQTIPTCFFHTNSGYLSFHQGAVNGDHATVYKPDLDTGGIDIERTGNNLLIHNSVLLNLFLFSWSSGL